MSRSFLTDEAKVQTAKHLSDLWESYAVDRYKQNMTAKLSFEDFMFWLCKELQILFDE